ncbi:glycosyltransferase family 2 protein [Ferruginibacter sp.]|nr:glycosyltransferase [Ferruginibacter sp.]
MKLAVGLCVRNEEKSIESTLNSIITSLKVIESVVQWKLFICINGSTDKSLSVIKSYLERNSNFTELIIRSEANLVEAQREIINQSTVQGYDTFIFSDADILVDLYCFNNLLKTFVESNYIVAYATSIPIKGNRPKLIERTINLYDTSSIIYTSRKHLHGRTFITKNWDIPLTNPKLIVDDIYLSFYYLYNFGEEAIKKVDNAIIYHHQIKTYTDFYRTYKRRSLEIKKCFKFFPEFKNLPAEQVNRKVIWKLFFAESFGKKLSWLTLFTLKAVSKIHFSLSSKIYSKSKEQWEITESSKLKIEKPIIILFEGLDCSGKKTIAKALEIELSKRNLMVKINTGPISPTWLKKLITYVSINKMPNFIRSIVYTFEPIFSKTSHKSENKNYDIILQISSPLRIKAYTEIKGSFIRKKISRLLRYNKHRYDKIYFFTAPYEIRKLRHSSQVKAGENNDDLDKRFLDINTFGKIEMILKNEIINNYKLDNCFNTHEAEKDNITNIILENIVPFTQ